MIKFIEEYLIASGIVANIAVVIYLAYRLFT